MQKVINGAMFKSMIVTAAKLLEINRVQIDALNVFPVPDGDTGTNMSLTFQSAVKELLNCQSNNLPVLADAVAKGALRGARGNSGVILSQVLRGFCNEVAGAPNGEIDSKVFAQGLMKGAEIAYGAVSKPKEGTMLTVARMVAEHASSVYRKHKDFETFLPEIISKGNEAVDLTPTLLPVLQKAGVVDAGGKGLMCLYEGMYKALMGESVSGDVALPDARSGETVMEHADIMSHGKIEFAYCTEFFIVNLNKKTTLADIEKLRETLMTLGDCVIVVGDLEFVKVHVHTNQPGVALTYALELGELDKLKIENMLEQNRALMKKYEEEKKPMGMLAISAGDGLTSIFKDLMVDGVIEGGQSMNPSANDIANAVQRINAENVFVFPNNKNIILAAEQAKSLVEGRVIHVIPTKNIPQGFAAALAFNPDMAVEENKSNMIHAIDSVTTGQITYAVRNTKIDGFDLKVGDIIGLDNKKILATGKDIGQVAIDLIERMRSSEEIITLYYGKEIKEEEAEELSAEISEKYPDCDVQIMPGGQPIYYYYIALE